MFDPAKLRQHFPILKTQIHGHPLAYLDNAATTQKPAAVIDAITNYYQNLNSNVHRGVHHLSELATDAYEQARKTVADFINADPEEIIFTAGTTHGINIIAHNYNKNHKVALTHLEHHANFVPWQHTQMYIFDPKQTKKLPEDIDLLTITGMSNITGEIPPIPERNPNTKLLIDAAQLAVHHKIDVKKINCDFLVFSGHKLLGPTGIGVLYIKKEAQPQIAPLIKGGGMIRVVNDHQSTFAEGPEKHEAGTPNIAGAIGLAKAIDFINQHITPHQQAAQEHEQKLAQQAYNILKSHPEITIQSPEGSPILSFTMSCAHPHDIASVLDQHGVAIRAGHHCGQPLMRQLNVPATARISLYYYNTTKDLQQLEQGLKQVIKIFN